MSLGNLSGVAFITGAGSGMGRDVSIAFAHCGAKLILVDMNEKGLQETAELCKIPKENIKTLVVDITNDDALIKTIRSIPQMSDFGGRLDYAINCAGVLGRVRGKMGDSDLADDDWIMNINLRAQGICNREQIKIMMGQEPLQGGEEEGRPKPIRPRGCIVNFGSWISFHGSATGWMYSASKHAVAGLTKSAAVAHAADGIRVNAVAPGVVKTALFAGDKATLERLQNIPPIKRCAEPYEIADAILFLCSDKATYINGHVLNIDGAWNAA